MDSTQPKYRPTEAEEKRLNNIFTFHPAKDDQAERYQRIRGCGNEMAILLVAQCPPSRELSLALTHLQQAVMCANAAIACNE